MFVNSFKFSLLSTVVSALFYFFQRNIMAWLLRPEALWLDLIHIYIITSCKVIVRESKSGLQQCHSHAVNGIFQEFWCKAKTFNTLLYQNSLYSSTSYALHKMSSKLLKFNVKMARYCNTRPLYEAFTFAPKSLSVVNIQ